MTSPRFVLCSASIALASFFALVRTVEGRNFWQGRATAERASKDGIEERLAASEEAHAAELAAMKARLGGLESDLEIARGAAGESEKSRAALVSAQAEVQKCREELAAKTSGATDPRALKERAKAALVLAAVERLNRGDIKRCGTVTLTQAENRGEELNQGVGYIEAVAESGECVYVRDEVMGNPMPTDELNQGVQYVEPELGNGDLGHGGPAVDTKVRIRRVETIDRAPFGKPVDRPFIVAPAGPAAGR